MFHRIILFVWISALFVSSHTAYAAEVKHSLSNGGIAPPFALKNLRFSDPSRQYISLSHWCGENAVHPQRALVLFFMQKKCKDSCAAEFKLLRALDVAYSKQNLRIMPILVDPSPDDAKAILKDIESAPESLYLLHDRFGIVQNRYKLQKFPSTFLLNQECRIEDIHTTRSAEEIENFIHQIRQLIGESSDDILPEVLIPWVSSAKP